MLDFAAARRMMVDSQLRTSDVTEPRLLAAMLALPRERFLPPENAALAYLDIDVPATVAPGSKQARCLLKPMVLARLIQAAEIAEGDHVLDVGCATGYSSAVLARLAHSVVALDDDAGLTAQARQNLHGLGIKHAQVVSGPLNEGSPAHGPYDAIILNGASEVVPKALLRQLKPSGRLAGIVRQGAAGKAMLYRSIGGEYSGRAVFDAAAPLLPGFAEPVAFVF
jgi:protein-L-isoaspartate(D-aspartate) O-methyltransferase